MSLLDSSAILRWTGEVARTALQPPPASDFAPIWSADAEVRARDAELQQHLSQGPPLRGTKEAPITWLFEPERFAPMAKLVGYQHYSILTDHLGTVLATSPVRRRIAQESSDVTVQPSAPLDNAGENSWSRG